MLKICSMNDSVEMTGNQFQQNSSVGLTGNFLGTFSTGNCIKLPVNLSELFNNVSNCPWALSITLFYFR